MLSKRSGAGNPVTSRAPNLLRELAGGAAKPIDRLRPSPYFGGRFF
jgi:hypothetical protein